MEIRFDDLPTLDLAFTHILGMCLHQPPENAIRYDVPGREDHILHYAVSGVRLYTQDDIEILHLLPGDLILLPMGSSYTTLVQGENEAVGYNIRFILQDDEGDAMGISGGPQCLLHDPEFTLLPHFKRLAELSLQTTSRLASVSALTGLMDQIIRIRQSPKTASWLTRALTYMGEHLQGPVSIADVSALCDMNERCFCRFFKEAVGQSPSIYHRQLRIRKAHEFLESGTFTVEATAEALGFTDAAHLSRCFFREFGIHAGALRREACRNINHRKKSE